MKILEGIKHLSYKPSISNRNYVSVRSFLIIWQIHKLPRERFLNHKQKSCCKNQSRTSPQSTTKRSNSPHHYGTHFHTTVPNSPDTPRRNRFYQFHDESHFYNWNGFQISWNFYHQIISKIVIVKAFQTEFRYTAFVIMLSALCQRNSLVQKSEISIKN